MIVLQMKLQFLHKWPANSMLPPPKCSQLNNENKTILLTLFNFLARATTPRFRRNRDNKKTITVAHRTHGSSFAEHYQSIQSGSYSQRLNERLNCNRMFVVLYTFIHWFPMLSNLCFAIIIVFISIFFFSSSISCYHCFP